MDQLNKAEAKFLNKDPNTLTSRKDEDFYQLLEESRFED
jgi:hypothetical protein